MNMSSTRLRWLYLRGPIWWGGLVVSLIGLVIIPIAFLIWQHEKEFQEHAVHAAATVISKETRIDNKAGKRGQTLEKVHLLVYTFQDANGRSFQGKTRVSADEWARAKKGDTRAIEYNGDNPAESRPAEAAAPTRWGLLLLGGVGVLFASVGIPLVAYSLLASGRRMRVVRDGVPALGVVDQVAENDSALKVSGTYRLVYHFTDQAGATWEGRGPAQSWALAARWHPKETILVLYDPRNPKRNEADVWEARNDDLDRLKDQEDEEQPNVC